MNTKQLRQKILDLAIRGKLVPQDPNDEPASVLLERVLAEKERLIKEGKIKRDKKTSTVQPADKSPYEEFDIPDTWVWARIIDIATLKSGGQYEMSETENSHPYIKVADMNSINNQKEICTSFARCICKPNELIPVNSIIFPKRGGAILTNKKRLNIRHPIAIDSNTMALIPFSELELLYIRFWLESFDLSSLWTGNVIPQINNQDIYPLLIPLPPLAEQHRIVQAIESAFAVIDEIEKNKQDLKTAVKTVKSKILSLAIQGKLVPQDPTDEPASVLLERIRKEKENLIKQGKIKRPKTTSAPATSVDNSPYENLPENWVWARLEEVLDYEQPTKYIVETTDYNDNFKTPVLTAGKSFIIGYTDEKHGICDNLPVVIFDDFTTDSKYVDFEFKVKSSAMKILRAEYADTKYLFYYMQTIYCDHTTHKRYWISDFSQKTVALPPIKEQKRIVFAIELAFVQLEQIIHNIN